MPPVKKGKQKSLVPAKQKKESEPRRSTRTPKISEKLKEYLDDQIGDASEQETRRSSRTPKISERLKGYIGGKGGTKRNAKRELFDSSASNLLGAEYKEAKVVLKALPKSALQNQSRRYALKMEPRVSLKRLGNTNAGNKKNTKVVTSKLLKRRSASKATLKSSQSALKKVVIKAEVKQSSSPGTRGPMPKRRGKRKRLNTDNEPKPTEKRIKRGPKSSKGKAQDASGQTQTKSRFDPVVMEKLFTFGAKVEEVLTFNSKAMDKLVEGCKKAEAITQAINEKLEDANVGDLDKILNWLEEEERQRKEHREAVLESLRVTYKTNMALCSHMLTVLKSVTASA